MIHPPSGALCLPGLGSSPAEPFVPDPSEARLPKADLLLLSPTPSHRLESPKGWAGWQAVSIRVCARQVLRLAGGLAEAVYLGGGWGAPTWLVPPSCRW